MTSEGIIRERVKLATDEDRKRALYWLRLVVGNFIDGQGALQPATDRKNGKYGDVTVQHWEEGRYNPIANNTQVAVEGLAFNRPDFNWKRIPSVSGRGDLAGAIRKAYYLWLFDQQNLKDTYTSWLLDLLTTGEANTGCFVRGEGVEVEWCDALQVGWDPAYKDPARRRYVTYQRPMTLGEAVKFYKPIANLENVDEKSFDKQITVTRYFDIDDNTEAALYREQFVDGPKKLSYPVLPIRVTRLSQLPSVKHSGGIVERQLGSHQLYIQLMRSFAEIALANENVVGVLSGFPNQDSENTIAGPAPNEGLRIVRSPNAGATFAWTNGPTIAKEALEVFQMVTENLNVESGVSSSKRGIPENANLATSVAYMAQQSSARDKFLESKLEEGVREDMQKLIMPIASAFEARHIPLGIPGHPELDTGQDTPINAILGSDGVLEMVPGGMAFKSEAQKLQEVMIFANVLALTASLPPGLAPRVVKMILDAKDVESPEEWVADMLQAMQAQAQAQQQLQDQQLAIETAKATKGNPAQAQALQYSPPTVALNSAMVGAEKGPARAAATPVS